MKNIAVIPARSGSKGLPDKNIKPLLGKPLLSWSIESARRSALFDVIHVSTDSERYAQIAVEHGADVPFLRSENNSSDTASSWSVVLEVLEKYERKGKAFDTVALLQPTAPLRTAEDICEAYQTMRRYRAKTVVSVCEADHTPLWLNTLPENHCMDGFISSAALVPRQAVQQYYRLNGAIYIMEVSRLREQGCLTYDTDCYAYVMPRERSIDIDVYMDFMIAETVMKNKLDNQQEGECGTV